MGGGVTISKAGENRRPRGLPLYNYCCVREEALGQGGRGLNGFRSIEWRSDTLHFFCLLTSIYPQRATVSDS